MAEATETVVEEKPAEAAVDEALEERLDEILEPEDDNEPEEEDSPPSEAQAHQPAPAASHPPELVNEAHDHLLTAEEIAGMTTEQLRIAVNAAKRVGQAVYTSFQKPAAQQPAEQPAAAGADELAVFDDPAKYDPGFIQPIKAEFAKLRQEIKAKDDRIDKLEKSHAASHQQTQHSRLMGLAAQIDPALPAHFDKTRYGELLGVMGGLHNANKALTEKQLFERAVKALDIPVTAPKDPLEEKKANWDTNALAKPATRKGTPTAEDRVREVLRTQREGRGKVNGESGRRK